MSFSSKGTGMQKFSSVQFSRTVMSDSLWPHEPQHARPPCPSPIAGVHPNPCPLGVGDAIQPSHPLWSPSPFCPQSFPASKSFQWVCSSHQGVKVLDFQLQHQSFQWIFRTDFLWDGLVGSLAVQRTLKGLLQHHSSKASILWRSAFLIVQLYVHSCCCSHTFCETNSLRRTMQIVEGSLLHWRAQGRVFS